MADLVGQQLGNYHLVRLLGRGGFAEVYLGEHIHLNTQAAVKVLYTHLDSDDLEKFRNEARTIARLEHPHIVRVLDFGVEDGVPFLIMQYAPHGTLRQRHPRGTNVPLITIVSYVQQIADALQYAHDEKLIHRDIKPENMLLGRHDEILLSDFGLATIAQSGQPLAKIDVAGTVTYMAPEQLRGKPTPASDQYALGIVIYEWLCGDYPFHGYSIETAIQHILHSPTPLHEKIPGVSAAVEQVVLRALEKEPCQRFADIAVFAQAFEQASTASTASQPFISMPHSATLPDPLAEEAFRTVSIVSEAARIPTPATAPIGTTICTYRGHTAPVLAVAWSPRILSSSPEHDLYVVSGSNDSTVQVWKLTTSANILTCRGHASWVHAVAWSSDGQHIASGSWDNTVQIWNVTNGSRILTYREHTKNVNTVAWDPDGVHLASGGHDQTVQVWDATSGEQIYTYRGHTASVNCVAWSPQGKRIASGSLDQTVQLWDAATGGHIFTYHGHSGGILAVAWSSSARIASGSMDGTVHVWDEAKPGLFAKNKVTIYHDHHCLVSAVAWSPNGKAIVSGGKDGTVHIWDALTGKNIYTYRNHQKQVHAIAWSPDGRFIASASEDRTVQVWIAP
ncbi:MAG: protein kinase domain-containing protein [Ktedonobacteraceae bacterium]